jgi:F1F0 ATPase subunit 2
MTINGFNLTFDLAAALLLAVLMGAVLSIFYFGGLWITIQRLERVRNPALLFFGSFLLRLGVVLAGFYLVSDGRIERLGLCLLSFLLTRQLILSKTQVPREKEQTRHGI